jgi:hypothetical protein
LDPVLVDIEVVPRRPAPRGEPGDLADELSTIRTALMAPEAGRETVGQARVHREGARTWVSLRYRYPASPDRLIDQAVAVTDAAELWVTVVGWQALSGALDGLASRIASSLVFHSGESRARGRLAPSQRFAAGNFAAGNGVRPAAGRSAFADRDALDRSDHSTTVALAAPSLAAARWRTVSRIEGKTRPDRKNINTFAKRESEL